MVTLLGPLDIFEPYLLAEAGLHGLELGPLCELVGGGFEQVAAVDGANEAYHNDEALHIGLGNQKELYFEGKKFC